MTPINPQIIQHNQPEPRARILAVDDDSLALSLVVALLETSGYEATPAADAESALLLLENDPDCQLVLADVRMPGVDGLSLLDAIRVNHPGLPVIMLTGAHNVDVTVSAFRRGAADFILKPLDRAQLLAAIARGLERGRIVQQSAAYCHELEEVVAARTELLRATMRDLERTYDSTLEVLGDALDLRDTETEGHSRRVTAYTIALARQMAVEARQLRIIARGAFLHDIGKIATPDRILLKPGKLDPDEVTIMRRHCEVGYEMVRKIPFLRDASEIVYTHQESFDGTGYPRGLRGKDIPLGSRIFAIVDTLDAMTSDRPYRRALSYDQARAEISRCSGTQFDPSIVDVFLGIPQAVWSGLRGQVENGPVSALAMAV